MRIIVGVVSFTLVCAVATVAAARAASTPSVCRGLEQDACAANAVCKWMPERVAGVTLTVKGAPAKTSAKAHCRKGSTKPVPAPA